MALVFQIIPGAYSPPSWYEGIRKHLLTLGYETLTTGLLSARKRDPLPPATMQDDAAHVRTDTLERVKQGKSVVLVMHTYGGIVGTESCKGLLKKDREAAGEAGGVVRLVYLTAAIVPVGGSVVKIFGGSLPSFMKSDVTPS